jgi:hypothetical protein
MPDNYAEFDFLVTDRPVAAMTCLRCGVAIILRESVDAVAIHDRWHARSGEHEQLWRSPTWQEATRR